VLHIQLLVVTKYKPDLEFAEEIMLIPNYANNAQKRLDWVDMIASGTVNKQN
jgi:hypothetical protein